MPGVGLAAPAQQELLRRRRAAGDDLVRDCVGVAVGEPRRARDDRHHLAGQPAEILARLLVGDLVQLPELPVAREARGLGLEVGGRVAREPRGLVGLGAGHAGIEVVVDEQPPDVLVRVRPDELLDVDAAVAQGAALAVGLGDLGLDGDDAFETRLEVAHRTPLVEAGSGSDGT